MTRRWLAQRLPRPEDCRRRLGLPGTASASGAAGLQAGSGTGPIDRLSTRLGAALLRLFEQPALWHLSRRSVAGAVAIGLFVGWLPLPGQMLIAALLAAVMRVHVPVSVVMVWFTNPLTIAPLGYVAWRAGSMLLGTPGPRGDEVASATTLLAQLGEVWPVLLAGSLFCAACSAVLGFALTLSVWRLVTVRRWRLRRSSARRPTSRPDADALR